MKLILGLLFICIWALAGTSSYKKGYTAKPIVSCDSKAMVVEIKADDKTEAFVDNFAELEECQATRTGKSLRFKFPLKGKFHRCGIHKLKHLITDKMIYFTKLTVRSNSKHDGTKENKVTVLCEVLNNHHRVRRQGQLPPDFEEAQVGISHEVSNEAPPPKVGMTIYRTDDPSRMRYAIPVSTNLTMDIKQDLDSAKFYGMLVKEIRVGNDVNNKIQTLVKDGCSMNKQIFTTEFRKVSNSQLQATFRAFKFPFSAYLKFMGTIRVCMKECEPVTCSGGMKAYGRKRRSDIPNDKSSYDLEIETIIKVTDLELGDVEKWGDLIIMKDKKDFKVAEVAAQLDSSSLLGGASTLSPSMNMLSSILSSIALMMLLQKL